jgi:hypothetical protein
MYPIVLWSVEVSQLTKMLPFDPTLDAPKSCPVDEPPTVLVDVGAAVAVLMFTDP